MFELHEKKKNKNVELMQNHDLKHILQQVC